MNPLREPLTHSLRQIGFGWTNGVVLCFLDKYGQCPPAELRRQFYEVLGFPAEWSRRIGARPPAPPHLAPLVAFGYFDELEDNVDVDAHTSVGVTMTHKAPASFLVTDFGAPAAEDAAHGSTPMVGMRASGLLGGR